jgi:hypothetical protein
MKKTRGTPPRAEKESDESEEKADGWTLVPPSPPLTMCQSEEQILDFENWKMPD